MIVVVENLLFQITEVSLDSNAIYPRIQKVVVVRDPFHVVYHQKGVAVEQIGHTSGPRAAFGVDRVAVFAELFHGHSISGLGPVHDLFIFVSDFGLITLSRD